MQRYSRYKDTGVLALGSIPATWHVKRAKYLFREINERSADGSETLLSVSEYYGVKPRSESIADNENLSRAETLEGYKKCSKDDFVMNIMLAWKCGHGVTNYDGIVSPAYSVFRPDKSKIVPQYAHYLSRTPMYTKYFKTLSTGIIDSRLRLYPDKFGTIFYILPPIEEQRAIATFLDRETARIDNLIAEKQTFIKLLKEKRQALISHLVTKGLDPNVKMKDSGIEWIGEVPEGWYLARVKQVSSFITSGPRGWSDFIDENGNSVFLQSGDLNNNLGLELKKAKRVSPPEGAEGVRTRLLNGDVVVCITGANTGRVAIAEDIDETVYINQHLSLIRPKPKTLRSKFLAYFLSSDAGSKYYAVTQYGLKEGLSLKNVAETPLAFPTLEEQEKIERRLDSDLRKSTELLESVMQSIEFLREHRTALISAAVTGKIDVRNHKEDAA